MEGESTLKLILEKGPREGETLEFKPGSLIRIGRVVRGNTVAVKDAGVSSKHLSIQFISGKWVLTDLDSSNGTVLNDSKLLPMDPSDLSSDDTIKIGEYTSIKVKIELGGQSGLRRNPRRRAKDGGLDAVVAVAENWRRKGGTKTNLASVSENSELGFRVGGELVTNQPGRPRSARVLKNEAQENLWELEKVEEVNNVGPIEPKQGRRVSSRRTRSSTKEENLNSDSMFEKIPENLGLVGNNCRESESSAPVEDVKIELGGQSGLQWNPRRRAKDGGLDAVVAVAENRLRRGGAKTNLASESENSELGFGVGGELGKNQPGRPRRARALKNEPQENLWELEKVEVNNVGPIEPKQGRRVSSRRTRSSTKEENLNSDSMLEKIPQNLGLDGNNCRDLESSAPVEDVKGKRTRGGTRRKRNLEDEPLESVENVFLKEVVVEGLNLQPEVCKEVESTVGVKENLANGLSEGIQVDVPEENEVVEDLNLRQEGDEELPSVSGVREGGVEARDEPDLEKMTLGEWFDYLEVYLPKQIHDVTEEMISNMRHRAEQFREFMLQHKNEKDEVKLPMG